MSSVPPPWATKGAIRQRGASLIELMVGLALGMLVVVAASMVFVASRQASRTTDGVARMQETARTTFDLMARELREAGGNPCDANVPVLNVLNAAQGATPAWWADWDRVLQGFDGATAFGGAAFGAAFGERVAGTAAVTAKFASDLSDLTVVAHDTAAATFTVNNKPHRAEAGDLLFICKHGQAAIAQASAVGADTITNATSVAPQGNCSTGLGIPTVCTTVGTTYAFPAGSKIGRLVAVGWYIGNNGRVETGGRSLFRVTRNGAEEVAEGVEDLQIEYLNEGGAAYVGAGAVTDWTTVVGMRLTLALRSPQNGDATNAAAHLQRPMIFNLALRNRMP